ncbi:MAG: DUF805 domain-containing protein [Rhizobacter sp.]|nr:DUF805 domain-containing protein [Rhizobacter sp.]
MDSSQAQVRLVFAGEVLEGFAPDEVRRRFGEAFKLDEARVAAMFAGGRTVLKRAMPSAEAERYVAKLRKLGMKVRAEPLEALPPVPPPPAAAAATGAAPAIPPLVPLEEEVVCPNCSERQPKRFVLCRQCSTDIPMALAARQEEADRARAERLAARQAGRGRFAPPRASTEAEPSQAQVEAPPLLSLSFQGRLGRLSYINAGAVAWAGIAVIGIVAAVLVPLTRSLLAVIPLGLMFLVFLVWSLRVMVLRLHDFNRSGWWVLVTAIPYLGAIASLALLFVPGTPEENDYGERPRQGNALLACIVIVVGTLGLVIGGSIAMGSYRQYVQRARQAESQQQGDPAAAERAGQFLHSPTALEAFRTQYLAEPGAKAFASGGGSAWGASTGRASMRDAATRALAACEERRAPYTAQCRLVNLDGAWVDDKP